MHDHVGEQLGNYRLLRLLGRGGFAEVYLGEHLHLKTHAALKLLHAQLNQHDAEQFLREAQTLARLNHPHIVRVLDYALQDDIPFLVMEYAPRGTLRTLHATRTPLPLETVVSYVQQMASALAYAHQQRLIHRDVKPENMLLNEREEVLLSDFGLALFAPQTLSAGTEEMAKPMAGTIPYMAPEQIRGEPKAASDQYALAVVVYEWLVGNKPFTGTFFEVLNQHLWQPPPSLCEHVPDLSSAVEAVVLRALAKDPKERFASVQDFAQSLQQASWVVVGAGPYATQLATPSLSDDKVQQRLSSSKPESPWNVPFARNPFFTGRGQLLEQLHAQLSHSRRAALNQSAALSGLGGIGKTQTAIEYAYRYRDESRAILWVRADNRETLIADYVAMAKLLALPGHDAQDQMSVIATVKRWLQDQQGWLLILDNADDLSLLPDFLPQAGKGQLLLTTRVQATGKIAKSVSVEKLEVSEGIRLLLRRAKLLEEDEPLETVSAAIRTAAQQLVEELDGLPLALDQAGAYIEETGCSLSEYLALYSRRKWALLKRASSMASEYPHTVASTWTLSFSQVEQADPAAADLLCVCAFLHPDAIPEAILTEGAAALGPQLQEVASDPLLLNEAIQLLRRYSLVKRDAEARLLNMHRLVQVVLKESLDEATQQQWAERTVRAVATAFPATKVVNWGLCEQFLPHVQSCMELIDHYGFSFSEAADLLNQAGCYLYERGRFGQAQPLLQRALAIFEKTLGPEHPETASSLDNLAVLYANQGKYEQAASLVQRALAVREKMLGTEHPETASSLDHLAVLYRDQGKFEQAEPLLERALAVREKMLGTEHPETAWSLDNLAVLYANQGKYEQAASLVQRALAINEKMLGTEHPVTLEILTDLGASYIYRGKYAQAESLLERALATRERLLGPESVEFGFGLQYLGWLSTLQGKYAQAESLLQRALVILERHLGPENRFAIRNLLYLARLSRATGQDARAESLYQQALTRFERVLGPQHPYLAGTLTGLAQLYTRQGHYQQAEPLLERALSIAGQVLGPMHPQTAMALDALGHLEFLQGRDEQAEQLLQRALTICEQALGNDHPDVAQTLHHLAQLYEKQGSSEQAHSFYQRALAIREQVLGSEHPDTIATREALARLQQTFQGQVEKSIPSQS